MFRYYASFSKKDILCYFFFQTDRFLNISFFLYSNWQDLPWRVFVIQLNYKFGKNCLEKINTIHLVSNAREAKQRILCINLSTYIANFQSLRTKLDAVIKTRILVSLPRSVMKICHTFHILMTIHPNTKYKNRKKKLLMKLVTRSLASIWNKSDRIYPCRDHPW